MNDWIGYCPWCQQCRVMEGEVMDKAPCPTRYAALHLHLTCTGRVLFVTHDEALIAAFRLGGVQVLTGEPVTWKLLKKYRANHRMSDDLRQVRSKRAR